MEEAAAAIEKLDGGVYGTDFGRAYVNNALKGLDDSGNVAGYVLSVTSLDGYDGNITLTLGLKTDGAVNRISFTELHETPGMGMRCAEPEFADQFKDKKVDAFVLNKAGNAMTDAEIDTVSGASTSSGAVVNAVNAGLDFFRTCVKGGE